MSEYENDEQLGIRVKAQGEDKPCMNKVDVKKVFASIDPKTYGGSEKKGAPIKGGISGEL